MFSQSLDRIKERAPILISCGVLYIMVYTPVWDTAMTGSIAGLTILLTLLHGEYKRYIQQHWKFLCLLFAAMGINIAFSPLPDKAATGAVMVLKGLALYPAALLAGATVNERLFRRAGMTLVLANCFLLAALMGIVADWENSQRIYVSLLIWSENHLGNLHNLDNCIFINSLLVICLVFRAHLLWQRAVLAIALIALLILSFLVQSEGSGLALIVCLLALFALYTKHYLRAGAVLLALVLVALLHLFYWDPTWFKALTSHSSHTLQVRSDIYHQLVAAWQQHPWLGWGFNSYKYVEATQVNGTPFLYPHHIFLEGLFSLGVFGAVIIGYLAVRHCRHINLSQIKQSPIQLFAYLCLIYIAVKGMSDMRFLSQQTVGWLIICFAILQQSENLIRQAVRHPSNPAQPMQVSL